jgi:hypothetical protein
VNNPVVNIIDRDGSAADFVLAVGRMSEQSAQAIVSQITASDNKPLLDWVRQMTDPVKQRQS